jgi:hypothetical protein
MELLQLQTASESIGMFSMQYGALGVLAFVLGYFAWIQYKRLVKKNDELEKKVDQLQEQMMTHLVEERDRMSELIRENTRALQELQKVIFEYMVKGND